MTTITVKPASDTPLHPLQNLGLVSRIFSFLNLFDRAIARSSDKIFLRSFVIEQFPQSLQELVPGGAAAFRTLPIQIFHTKVCVPYGKLGEKPVVLEPKDILPVKGKIPPVLIGLEYNTADPFNEVYEGWGRDTCAPPFPGVRLARQPLRPVLVVPVQGFREARSCACCQPLSLLVSIHTIFEEVVGTKRLDTWGAFGPIPTKLENGTYEDVYASEFYERLQQQHRPGTDCFHLIKDLLAGKVLQSSICAPPWTTCTMDKGNAFFNLFFRSDVKMRRLPS